MLSKLLKETLMQVYDMRPSTAEEVMKILEHISSIVKTEYAIGYGEGFADGFKEDRDELHEETT